MRCFLLVILLALGGCATPLVYNEEGLDESQLAHLQAEKIKAFSSKFKGALNSVQDESGKHVVKPDGWKHTLETMSIQPGTYIFTFYCSNGSVYAHPSIKFSVEAGKEYEYRCINHTEKGLLGIEMNKSVTAEIVEID